MVGGGPRSPRAVDLRSAGRCRRSEADRTAASASPAVRQRYRSLMPRPIGDGCQATAQALTECPTAGTLTSASLPRLRQPPVGNPVQRFRTGTRGSAPRSERPRTRPDHAAVGRGARSAAPCGWGWTAVSLAATLLVCAAFRLDPCQECPFVGVSARGSVGAARRPGRISSTGPRKDASWQLPALRRPVVRRALTLPAVSHSAGSPNTLRSPTSSPSRPSPSTGWSATRLGQTRSADDPHARSGPGRDPRRDQSH